MPWDSSFMWTALKDCETVSQSWSEIGCTYHCPDMESNGEQEIQNSDDYCCLEFSDKQKHQASLEDVCVKEHQEYHDDCKDQTHILNTGKTMMQHSVQHHGSIKTQGVTPISEPLCPKKHECGSFFSWDKGISLFSYPNSTDNTSYVIVVRDRTWIPLQNSSSHVSYAFLLFLLSREPKLLLSLYRRALVCLNIIIMACRFFLQRNHDPQRNLL